MAQQLDQTASTARSRNLRTRHAVVMPYRGDAMPLNKHQIKPEILPTNVNSVLFIHFTQDTVHCLIPQHALHIQFRTKLGLCCTVSVGRDNSVGTATRYGLDGPGIEYRWWARFSAHVQTGPGAHSASYKMDTGSFPGVKLPMRGVNHPHLAPSLKKE